MQLRHGDNLGNGFCTSTCAKPILEIVPMAILDGLCWISQEVTVKWVNKFQTYQSELCEIWPFIHISCPAFWDNFVQIRVAMWWSFQPKNKQKNIYNWVSSIFRYSNTLGAEMFGGRDFWLETRVIIKISTHS